MKYSILFVLIAFASRELLQAMPGDASGQPSSETIDLAQEEFNARLKRAQHDRDAAYDEIKQSLPKEGQRAKSARLELAYWFENSDALQPMVRNPVQTKDGKDAEVLILSAPADSIPGTDFSMAFLLVEKRVVDWRSCWTYNRTASQKLKIEDVDGDSFQDVAFRASAGCYGLLDNRKNTRPEDDRVWLYAYAITATGFESLFPTTDRNFRVKTSYDTSKQPVTLKAEGIPETLHEYEMCECIVSATNTSKKPVALPGQCFELYAGAQNFMTYGPLKKDALQPGETISQTICLYLYGKGGEVELRWRFVPKVASN